MDQIAEVVWSRKFYRSIQTFLSSPFDERSPSKIASSQLIKQK